MADVKMTRVEMFNAIKAVPQVAENQEMVDFIDNIVFDELFVRLFSTTC